MTGNTLGAFYHIFSSLVHHGDIFKQNKMTLPASRGCMCLNNSDISKGYHISDIFQNNSFKMLIFA